MSSIEFSVGHVHPMQTLDVNSTIEVLDKHQISCAVIAKGLVLKAISTVHGLSSLRPLLGEGESHE